MESTVGVVVPVPVVLVPVVLLPVWLVIELGLPPQPASNATPNQTMIDNLRMSSHPSLDSGRRSRLIEI
jgi:hypothetical protein